MRFGSTFFGLSVTATAAIPTSVLAVPTAAETFSVQHSGIFWDGSNIEPRNGGAYTTVFNFEASAVDDLVITGDEITSFTATTTSGMLLNSDDEFEAFPGFVYNTSNSTVDDDSLSAFVFISLNLVSPGVYEVDDEIVLSETFYRIVTNDNTRQLGLETLLDFNEPRSAYESVDLGTESGFRESIIGNDGTWTQIVVPEPTSLTVLAFAGLGLIMRRRRS